MPLRRPLLSCIALAALAGGPALAQKAPPPVPAPPPVVAVEEKPADDDPSGVNHVVPELKLEAARLEDAVDQLQAAQPRFRAVVIRDADVPADYPTLTLKVRNVSIGQFMELVTTSYPGVSMSAIDGPKGALTVLKVSNVGQPGVAALGGGEPGGGGLGGGGLGGVSGAGRIAGLGPTVRVYRLTPLVEQVVAARGQGAQKDALASVLSLLKAALTQADNPREQVVLQVHEETQTLVFRGTAAQQHAVEQVIAALSPADSRDAKVVVDLKDQVRALEARVQEQQKLRAIEADTAQVRLKDFEAAANELRQAMIQREIEMERMKVRLEAAVRAAAKADPAK